MTPTKTPRCQKAKPAFTRAKLKDFRRRIARHSVVGDTAVVLLTARELEWLLDLVEKTP